MDTEKFKTIVKESNSVNEVLRKLDIKLSGGSHSHYSKKIKTLGLDTSHFSGKSSNLGKVSTSKVPAEQILIKREAGNRQKHHRLKRALIESGLDYICSKCKLEPFWLGKELTLDVDHINENWLDDRKENLRFLCPNCHSQFSRKLLGD